MAGPVITPLPPTPGGFLPRLGAAMTAFTSVFFGPNTPQAPQPDTQAEGPRGFNYQTNYNVTQTPRASEGLTPFQSLINIAQLYDTAAACIRYRVEELSTMEWDVVDIDKDHPSSDDEKRDYRQRLECPDGQTSFEDWIAAAVEETLVTDALSIYVPRNRKGEVLGYELIAGDTIRTLSDAHGRVPRPPAPSHQQIIYGRIAWEGDTSSFLYAPKTRRTRSLYGRSPTEEMVLLINRALRRQTFDLNWYAEGNTPEGLVPIADLPPEQIEALQVWLDNIVNAQEQRRKLQLVPSTSGRLQPFMFKEPILNTEVELFLDKRAMAFYGVPAQNLGFSDHNRAAGALQENVSFMRQLALVKFEGRVLRTMMNMQKVVGQAPSGRRDPSRGWKCQVLLHGETPEEDKLRQAQVDKIEIGMGKTTVDEARARDGQAPLGIDQPYVLTTNGPVYLKEALEQQSEMGKVTLQNAKNPPQTDLGGPEGIAGGQGHGGGGDAQKTDDGQPIDGKPTETGGEGKFGDGVSRVLSTLTGDEKRGYIESSRDILLRGGDPLAGNRDMLRELNAWERYAKHRNGRPARPFVADAIPEHLAADIKRQLETGAEPGVVFGDVRRSLGIERADLKKRPLPSDAEDDEGPEPASPTAQRRDRAVLPLLATVASGVLAATSDHGTMVDQSRDVLQTAVERSYRAGLAATNPAHVWGEADSAYVGRVVDEQVPYLQGFLDAITTGAMSDEGIAARAALYGEPLFGAYSRGMVVGGADLGVESYGWRGVGDAATCENCDPRIGRAFGIDELDGIGYPGENNFSDDETGCRGVCRCWLEAISEGE